MAKRKAEDVPEGLTKWAKAERKRFLKSYHGFLEKSEEISLSVLVWGQNPSKQTAVARKRKSIRQELVKLGHNAMFSEEISGPPENVSEKSKEFAQALAADVVIALIEEAPGALAEVHDFCDHPGIAPKLYLDFCKLEIGLVKIGDLARNCG